MQQIIFLYMYEAHDALHDVSNANFTKMNNFLYANWLRAMVDN